MCVLLLNGPSCNFCYIWYKFHTNWLQFALEILQTPTQVQLIQESEYQIGSPALFSFFFWTPPIDRQQSNKSQEADI